MTIFKKTILPFVLTIGFLLGAVGVNGQTMMPIPPHSAYYCCNGVRGYYFIAPVDFTITGLRVPLGPGNPPLNNGTQSLQVIKVNLSNGLPLYPTTTTSFTTLYYGNGITSGVIQPVNIPVHAGDTIGILGYGGTQNSHSAYIPLGWPTTIDGQPLTLNRLVHQGQITSTPATTVCTEITTVPSYFVGLIEMYYQSAPKNDAGIDSLIAPAADGQFCSGEYPVKVRLTNFGSNSLGSVKVHWSIDGTPQQTQSLTFNPPIDSSASPNNSTIVTLGTVNFSYQTPVHIKAWTSDPNGQQDSKPDNDDLAFTITSQMQSVSVDITTSRSPALCEGDTITLDAGQQPAGASYQWSNGAQTRKITVNQTGVYTVIVQSAEGCSATDQVAVSVTPTPHIQDFQIIDQGYGNFRFTPIGASNATDFHWDFGDGSTRTVNNDAPQTHHYNQVGSYPVTLVVSTPCKKATITKQIFVELTGITGINIDHNLKVYPNPTSDKLTIKITDADIQLQHINVFDVSGARVFEANAQGQKAYISLGALAEGVYQLQIQTNKGVVNKKLNIMK